MIPVSGLSPEQRREFRGQAGMPEGEVVLSFFGFIRPHKGFERALDVVKLLRRRGVAAVLLVLGELADGDAYHRELRLRIAQDGLEGCVKVLGYLPHDAVSDYLMVSDACILPFVDGVHPKSGSFLAAVAQGVLTITTSTERTGLSETENVYYARPGDVEGMAAAAEQYAGRRLAARSGQRRTWDQVAREHIEFFEELLRPGKSCFSLASHP
jgi:glycosyltransferase involved in cell wall biosynthesis